MLDHSIIQDADNEFIQLIFFKKIKGTKRFPATIFELNLETFELTEHRNDMVPLACKCNKSKCIKKFF